MAHPIKAIIFDADGTLLDTREFIYQAFEQSFRTHGHVVPTRDLLLKHMGKPLADIYEALARDLGADIEKLVAHHKELHRSQLLPLVAGYEGIRDLFASIRALDMKIAVCTNRDTHAKHLFEHIGIRDEFDAFITSDDMQNLKPDPEGIRTILTALNLKPEHAVMVGDTEADMGAGKNAGVAIVIGVTHGFGTEAILREHGADHVVGHLSEILPIIEAHAQS